MKFLAAAGDRHLDSEATIKELCLDTLETSLRDACTSKPYQKIFEGREEVASEIEKSVADDFSKSGMQLDSAKLTEVDPAPIDIYNPSNPQHAKGLTAIVKITEDERFATEHKKLLTSEALREIEIATQKRILEFDKDAELARSSQEKGLAIQRALDSRAAEENEIVQAEAVDKRRIAKDLAVQLESVRKEQETETVSLAKSRAIAEVEIEKAKSLDIAEQDRLIQVLLKNAERAKTEEETHRAQAAAERARQQIQTVAAAEEANVRR